MSDQDNQDVRIKIDSRFAGTIAGTIAGFIQSLLTIYSVQYSYNEPNAHLALAILAAANYAEDNQ